MVNHSQWLPALPGSAPCHELASADAIMAFA